MVEIRDFVEILLRCGAKFFSGVPDSLLTGLSAELDRRCPRSHAIACNEGSAVALAIGAYAATMRVPVVYMQNSGLGNAHNPLISLANLNIYGTPMLIIVGWRAEMLADGMQMPDEPQHRIQGRTTLGQLDLLDIPYRVVQGSAADLETDVRELMELAVTNRTPVALVFRKGMLRGGQFLGDATPSVDLPSREAAIEACLDGLPTDTAIVATTGMASRELYELRTRRGESCEGDLLVVGGMGHASQIALGATIADPTRRVACIDGDGAFFMHMGSATQVRYARRFIHIVMNNGVHDSVGGAPTVGNRADMCAIARASGYRYTHRTASIASLIAELQNAVDADGASFLEILCRPGHRTDIGRPTSTPRHNFDTFSRNWTNSISRPTVSDERQAI